MTKTDADKNYLFKSARLGFRNWEDADIVVMAAISGDEEVMEFFPGTQTPAYTADFIRRMQLEFAANGYCYFAVDRLDTATFIGFIGIHEQTFESDFTPCVDIGWRLKKEVWNSGFASEGAIRCLEYAFRELGIKKIYSITPKVNVKSERIMQKIGMTKVKDFIFPLLKDDERLKECVLYKIDNAGAITTGKPGAH
jgi:RimJ/RimL family protein N-acetyltransferase